MTTLRLYAHPFASYCQKVLIALCENETVFEYRALTPEHPEAFLSSGNGRVASTQLLKTAIDYKEH